MANQGGSPMAGWLARMVARWAFAAQPLLAHRLASAAEDAAHAAERHRKRRAPVGPVRVRAFVGRHVARRVHPRKR